MNVFSFVQELSSLIIRYTKERAPNPSPDENVPLTKPEIETAVKTVLVTLFRDNETDNSFKAPVTGNVSTPIAANNIDRNANDGDTCRSGIEATQRTPINYGISCPDLKEDGTKVTHGLFEGKQKEISRSSPAICLTTVNRSDTFIFEENENARATVNVDNLDDPFAKVEITSGLLQSVNEIRMNAMSFIEKLDDFKKQATSKSLTRKLPKRDTNFNRMTSNITKTGFTRECRSIGDISATPTSSRSLVPDLQDITNKRKSIGSTSICMSRKLDSTAPITRSMSNLDLSPNKSLDSINRPRKNPKYAHIKSTIPKPVPCKRKGQ